MKKSLVLSMLLIFASLGSGCSKGPLDSKFDLSSLNAITESAQEKSARMDSDQQEVIGWAANTLNLNHIQSLTGFKEQYGEKVTYRVLIKKAVETREETVNNELKRLQELKTSWNQTFNDLSKIKASNIELGKSSEFMTSGHPLISFDVTNGSQSDVSLLVWKLELFLNGEKEPYTSYNAVDSYVYGKKNNGLLAGETVRRSVTVDTFFNRQNADKWVDLNARKASSKQVKVTVIPTSIKDFNKQKFITGDINAALEEIESESKTIEKAKKYL